jgi:hypothetical protein
MSYTAVINRANPTAFFFLIDQSRSMAEKMEAGESKTKLVGDVLNRTLFQLLARCASTDGARDYFDIGVLVYDGFGARSGFAGSLSASSVHPISALAAHPLRIEERNKRVPDGAGGIIGQRIKFPVWFESVSEGDAQMREGFRKAAECVVSWCNAHGQSHPPTVIHVAGGLSADGDPEPLAEAIRHISTNHGQCLLFNLHVGASETLSVFFPASEISLPDAHSKMLFRMSSLFPAHLVKAAQEKGYSATSESRFFGYKAGYQGLVNFFDIGSRVSNLLLKESTPPPSTQTVRSKANIAPNVISPQPDSHSSAPRSPEPTDPTSVTSAELPDPQSGSAVPARIKSVHGGSPMWHQGARMLGLAVAVIAAITLFKLFNTRGQQPTQLSDQTATIGTKDDSGAKRQPSNGSQSIGSSGEPNVPVAVSNAKNDSALPPAATKIGPPVDSRLNLAARPEQMSVDSGPNLASKPDQMSVDSGPKLAPKSQQMSVESGPKLAAKTEQMTEPAPGSAPMPSPKNIDPPRALETEDTSQSTVSAAQLDLTKAADVKRIQQRLIDLGYFLGPANGVWGPRSKRALSDFRSAEKLGQDDRWDQETEMKLLSLSAAKKQQNLAFVGGWSKDASSCADASIKITASQAKSRDAACNFTSIHQEAEDKWRVQAHCELDSSLKTSDTANTWTSTVELTLDDRRLTWQSEKGAEDYYRCSQ